MASGTVTPGGAWAVILTTAVAQDMLLEAVVSLRNMVSGDSVAIQVWRKTNGVDWHLISYEEVAYDSMTFNEYNLANVWCSDAMPVQIEIKQLAGPNKSFFWRSKTRV